MRGSLRRGLPRGPAALLLLVSGCALSLDPEQDAPSPDAGAPTLPSCALLADPARGVIGVTGRASSLALPDGTRHLAADSLETTGGAVAPAVFPLASVAPDACLAGEPVTLPAAGALDLSPLGAGLGGRLLAPFVVGDALLAYVEAARGLTIEGVALARWDGARFVADPGYLFTADRPRYGDAVLVEDDHVYAYGCRGSGFLAEDCYVARAPLAELGDRGAYRYYRGAGGWADDPDGAWPLFAGGGGLAVARRGDRVVAAYATPLGDTIWLRAGLSPDGPWSAPLAGARCRPPAGGFCGALALHPALGGDAGGLWLTHGVASFDGLPASDRQSQLLWLPLAGLP